MPLLRFCGALAMLRLARASSPRPSQRRPRLNNSRNSSSGARRKLTLKPKIDWMTLQRKIQSLEICADEKRKEMPKRSREEVDQAAFESFNRARRLDGLPPIMKQSPDFQEKRFLYSFEIRARRKRQEEG